MAECQDGPQHLHSGHVVSGEFRARDDHHTGDFEHHVPYVVECSEERVLVASNLELFAHAGPVRRVQRILVEPFDVEAQAAECEQDAVEFAHELFLFGGVMAWVPLGL